jgi:voltage-gated potassium channel Kch
MTMPVPDDTLLTMIQDRVGAVIGDLAAVLEHVRKRLAQLALDPTKIKTQVGAIVDEVLAEMALAGRRAVRAGSDRETVDSLLTDKRKRMQALSASLRAAERPSPAAGLALLRGAR